MAQAPVVRVAAIPEYRSVRSGDNLRVAVRLVIPEGWHLGWINPGGTGLPTTLTWSGDGIVADGPTAWPYPELERGGGTVSHTYRGEIVIVSPLRIASTVRSGRVDLRGSLTWGICAEVCIPQERAVFTSVTVRTSRGSRSPAWTALDSLLPRMPARPSSGLGVAAPRGDSVTLTVTGLWGLVREVTVFPSAQGELGLVVTGRSTRNGTSLRLPTRLLAGTSPVRLAGVLVPRGAPREQALVVDLEVPAATRR